MGPSTSAVALTVLAPGDLAQELCEAWPRLQGQGGLQSPFLSLGWLRALERAEGPDAGRLRVVVAERRGEAAGFLAVRKSGRRAGAPGAPLCDYQAVVAGDDLNLGTRAVLDALDVDRLDFAGLIPASSGLEAGARARSRSFALDLRGGMSAYAAERRAAGSEALKDLAKKRRRLVREAGEPVFAEDPSPEAFERLLTLKRAQYVATGQPDIFAAGWPTRLLKRLLETEDPDCRARLFSLSLGEERIALHLALCSRTVAHAWFIAHDEAYAKHSPGAQLLLEVAGWAAGEGLQELDLGPGEYPFKRRFAGASREVLQGFVGRPSGAVLIRDALWRLRVAAEALPLGAASSLPGKAMRRLDLIGSL